MLVVWVSDSMSTLSIPTRSRLTLCVAVNTLTRLCCK